MKRQLTVRFILILIAAYAALASVFPNIKAVAQETGDYVTAFDFSISAGKYATAHSSNWAVRIWDASNNQLLRTIQVHDPRRKFMGYASINNVVFSPSGDKLAITQWGDVPGLIIIVEASTGETLLEISGML